MIINVYSGDIGVVLICEKGVSITSENTFNNILCSIKFCYSSYLKKLTQKTLTPIIKSKSLFLNITCKNYRPLSSMQYDKYTHCTHSAYNEFRSHCN